MVNFKIGKNRNRLGHKPLKPDLIKILYPGKKSKKSHNLVSDKLWLKMLSHEHYYILD
jgi:hypothetical protein